MDKVFSLDLRSLAAFRVALALFIFYDLLTRSFDLTAHYTDAGALPRAWANLYYSGSPVYDSWNPLHVSVHMLTGSATGILGIFLIHAIAAAGLLLGYRTRLMTFIVWFLLSSLHTRNPMVLSVGDDVLRVMLFFSIFLPLGARYSIDAALNTSRRETGDSNHVYTAPSTAVYYLQFICIYFFSALLKTGTEWRIEGSALYYAFNFDQFATPFAQSLLVYPALLRWLTFASWWIELMGGFILLLPHYLAKLAGVFLFAGLQLGIGLTLALGHNPWVNSVILLPFLPSWIWNRGKERSRVEIVYDGDCGFCRKMLAIVVEFLRPAMSQPPRPALGKDLATLRRENSWIVRNEAGTEFFRFDAFIQVVSSSPLFFRLAPAIRSNPVRAIGNAAYGFIAKHRPSLGKLLAPFRFRHIHWRINWWRESLCVFFFIGAVVYNVSWISPTQRLYSYFAIPTLTARLEQYWGMFAPFPNKEGGWYIIEGRLTDGTVVDAFREERQIRFERPASVNDMFPNERWRRYMMNVGTRDLKDFRPPFMQYLCRNWNDLERMSMFFMLEMTPPPGGQAKVEKLNLIDFRCR